MMLGIKDAPTVQVNGYGTLSVNTENDDDNGSGVPLPTSRSTQRMSTFTRHSSSSTNLSSPLSHGVNEDFGRSNSSLPRIGSASSYSKVITTTTKLNRTGSASKFSSSSSSASPRSKVRPGTAMGSNVDSERRGLKSSQHFSETDRTIDYSTRRTHTNNPGLQPIPEDTGLPPLGVYVSRGGLRRPKSAVIFSTARRPELTLGNGATVPFHYVPPKLLERDPTTEVKNAPKVPFCMSTRDQWQRAHMAVASTAAAGPGAYDPNVDRMSTKRVFPIVSFTTAKRNVGADSLGKLGNPGPYTVQFIEKHTPHLLFSNANRDGKGENRTTAGPYDIHFVEKHRPVYKFSTAPGHDLKPSDPATAAVPLRGGERVRKHKPVYKFSTAPRFAF